MLIFPILWTNLVPGNSTTHFGTYLVGRQAEVKRISGALPERVVPGDERLNERTPDLSECKFVIPDGNPEAGVPGSVESILLWGS